jgi:hypothetical protein
MQFMLFLFLARDRKKDIGHIDALLSYQAERGDPVTLVLFPEGTDLADTSVAKSDAFAAKNGLPKYQNVLHPKVAGWRQCLESLTREGSVAIDAVYDVTMGYEDYVEGERPNELSLLNGRAPKKVFMHVRRHALGSLPDVVAEPEAIESWCRESFKRKEEMLTAFYDNSSKQQFGKYKSDAERAAAESVRHYSGRAYVLVVPMLCCAAHFAVTLLATPLLLNSWPVRVYAFGMFTFLFLVTQFAGGMDKVELALCSKKKKKKD